MLSRTSTAASSAELPPTARGPLPGVGEARRQAQLPAWADSLEGRAIVRRILLNPPLQSIEASSDDYAAYGRTFRGRDAADLRRLYRRQCEALSSKENALWKAGQSFAGVHDQLNALFGQEQPDALIARLIREAR